jgi:hypothetical protein
MLWESCAFFLVGHMMCEAVYCYEILHRLVHQNNGCQPNLTQNVEPEVSLGLYASLERCCSVQLR